MIFFETITLFLKTFFLSLYPENKILNNIEINNRHIGCTEFHLCDAVEIFIEVILTLIYLIN